MENPLMHAIAFSIHPKTTKAKALIFYNLDTNMGDQKAYRQGAF